MTLITTPTPWDALTPAEISHAIEIAWQNGLLTWDALVATLATARPETWSVTNYPYWLNWAMINAMKNPICEFVIHANIRGVAGLYPAKPDMTIAGRVVAALRPVGETIVGVPVRRVRVDALKVGDVLVRASGRVTKDWSIEPVAARETVLSLLPAHKDASKLTLVTQLESDDVYNREAPRDWLVYVEVTS